MVVVSHFAVPEEQADRFAGQGEQVLRALAACAGYVRGRLGRAADDPTAWVLVTEWTGVGSYRRALSARQVKLVATPLLALSRDEPSAYEVIRALDAGQEPVTGRSDRAAGDATAVRRPR